MKLLTANRLRDGAVVYWGPAGAWTPSLPAAVRLEDVEAATALKAAAAASEAVVAAYLVDLDAGEPVPRERLRERIRAGGPTAGSLHPDGA